MSSPRPRLCFIITRMVAGGAQKVMLDLVQRLRDSYEISIIAGRETGREGSLWDVARVLLPGERIHVCPYLVRNPNPVMDLLAYFQVKRLISRIRPDIVHTHTSKAGAIGRLAAQHAGVARIVHSTHGLIYDSEAKIPNVSGHRLKMAVFKAVDRYLGRKTHATICLSEKEVGDALRLKLGPPKNFFCIPNGILLEGYASLEREPVDWSARMVRIGTAGRLNREKGHEVLLESFKRLISRFPNVHLDIAGDGPLRGELKNQCAALGLQESVTFHGYQKDMLGFMAMLDIFVLSSHYEGFGLVLVEAMAAGLPVVATDVGGVSEVLDGGKAGIVVPPDSAPDLAMGMEYLLQNPHVAMELGMKGRVRVIENYSLDHMIEAHDRLYRPLREPAAPLYEARGKRGHAADLHIHSRHSFDSSAGVDEILARAVNEGLKAIAITDHDEIEGALQAVAAAPEGLIVVPGIEVSTEEGDIVGLFVREKVRARGMMEAIAAIREQGGLVMLPHPFRSSRSVSVELLSMVDAIEIVNGRSNGTEHGRGGFGDREIAEFARANGKTGIGGSDAHSVEEVGRVRSILPPFSDAEQLRSLLESGVIFPVIRNGAPVPLGPKI